MSDRCTGEPISWLHLEQYVAGISNEADRIRAHLADCPACTGCLERIEAHNVKLPRLVMAATPPPRRWLGWPALSAAMAAAAAILLIVLLRRGDAPPSTDTPLARVAIKGGDVAIDLMRERAGVVTEGARSYRSGDRFKVLFTCPGGLMHADVLVLQDGEAAYPFAPAAIDCRNRAPLAGAFRLTGQSPATVCVLYDRSGTPDRVTAPSGSDAVCVRLLGESTR